MGLRCFTMKNKVGYLCLIILFMQGCRIYNVPELKLAKGKEVILNSELSYVRDTTSEQRCYFAIDSILVCNTNLSRLGKNISERIFTYEDVNKIRSEMNLGDQYIEIVSPKDLPFDYGCSSIDYRNKHCLYLVIPFKKLELFSPVVSISSVFKFKPIGLGYYIRVIPITYIDSNDFIIHADKNMLWDIEYKIRKALFDKLDSLTIELWIERCSEGEKVMRMPLYMRAIFDYVR